MTQIGSEANPLRVAVIGAGPAGFYTISNFQKFKEIHTRIDLYDRLPTPFGLVRNGVAPDHQKDKSVTRAYDKSAQQPNVRFFGNVEYGTHIHMNDLKQHYHMAMFSNGAKMDRSLEVPGEDLAGSHSATDFVAWYNGHPDYVHLEFDLSQESVAIVGIGNVAVDVARMLCMSDAERRATDMADHAVEALAKSNVKHVYMLGRRGPAQAAFTPPEIKELGELEDADIQILADEGTLDALSQDDLDANGDKNAVKNVELIGGYAGQPLSGKSKTLTIRFLVSPTELQGDKRVSGIRIVRNELYLDDRGNIRPRAIENFEDLPAGLVFRSVGYRGSPLPDVPFHEGWGSIHNELGRVTDGNGNNVEGLYCAGWIKRGPTGVIGTNKTDAQETVKCMVEDMKAGLCFSPSESAGAIVGLLQSRQPDMISYDDWSRIDAYELAAGDAEGRPRVKLTSVPDMLKVARAS